MSLSRHLGFSEEDVEAAEVLDELRKTVLNQDLNSPHENKLVVQRKEDQNQNQNQNERCREGSSNLLNRVMNNVATFYDDRRKVASIARLLDDAYEDNYTTSEGEIDSDLSDSEVENDDTEEEYKNKNKNRYQDGKRETEDEDNNNTVNLSDKKRSFDGDYNVGDSVNNKRNGNIEVESFENNFSKRQKISDAIDNFKEYKFNMSIESKKRLIACLHLLKLANKQLSEKITNLQDLVQKENEAEYQYQLKLGRSRLSEKKINNKKTSISSLITHSHDGNDRNKETIREKQNNNNYNNGKSLVKKEHQETLNDNNGIDSEEDEDEEFFDTFDSKENNEQATIVKMEVVGTIKKIYSMISRFTGNSLPEPARSQVRASLLNLPTNWSSTVSNLSLSNNSLASNNLRRGSIPTSEDQYISTNGKVLILAKESLDMVQNVMEVVDSTLGKAEEWVKQKQEIKEALYEKFMQAKNTKER